MFRIFPPSPVEGGGGVGWYDPPGDRPLIVVDLRGKKQSMRLDGISRMHILFLVLAQHLISLEQVKGEIFAKIDIFCFTRS